MLFKRRAEQGWSDRVRGWIWPRKGWRRPPIYYLKRVLRLSGTPYAIAMGAAIGVFASMTPFIGFHFLITFALVWLLGANMIAGAFATVVGNPLTFPFIWAATYEFGHFILNGWQRDAPARLTQQVVERPAEQILPLIKPMLVGALPIGLVAATITYVLVHKAVSAYQHGRRHRLEKKRLADGGRTTPVAAETGSGH